VIAVLLVALAAAAPAANDGTQTWTTRRAIVLPAVGMRAFVEAPLDVDVYAGAEPTLADLRVRERDGTEVAYVIQRHDRPAVRPERNLPLVDLVVTPARQTRFVLDLGPGPALHDGVRLRVGNRTGSFRVPVRVETSADGVTWNVARAAGFIYDVAGDTRAVDTTVRYPVSSARWLRVTVEPSRVEQVVPAGPSKVALQTLPVLGATVLQRDVAVEREEDVVTATIVERERDTGRRVSRVVLDLGSRRPFDRVELDVGDRNFHRVATFEAGDDRRQWRWAGSGALSALDTPQVRERETRVHLPKTTARYVRVTIHDQDDRPLEITGARVAGPRRTLVFEALAGREYFLDYGNPRAAAPRYDIERTVRALGATRLPRATLGPPAALPPPARPRWLDAQPVAMWAAMAVAVVALGALLVRLARSVRPA
jgi:hypothetical protein